AERILLVGFLGGWVIGNGEHFGFAVWMAKTLGEEARCAFGVFSWAGPEDAPVFVDFLPGDAIVVGDATFGGNTQGVPDVQGRLVGKELATSEACGEVTDDPPVSLCLSWWVCGTVDFDDAALEVGGGPLVLAP